MKIDDKTLSYMESDIRVMLDFFKIDPKKTPLDVNMLNNIWFHTFMNRKYDDNNPNVKKDINGKRILSQIIDYDLYPCETNDTTIYTALRKILVNLQK